MVSFIIGPGSLFLITGFTGFHDGLFGGVPRIKGQVKLLPIKANIVIPSFPIPSEAALTMFHMTDASVRCSHVTLIDGDCSGDHCNGSNLFNGDKATPENCTCFHKVKAGSRTFVVASLKVVMAGKTYNFDNVINKEFQKRYIITDEPSTAMHSARFLQGPFIANRIRDRYNQVFTLIPFWNVIGWAKPGLLEDALDKESSQKAPNGTKSTSEANLHLVSSGFNLHLVSIRPAISEEARQLDSFRIAVERLINDKLRLSVLSDEQNRELEEFELPDEEDVFFRHE